MGKDLDKYVEPTVADYGELIDMTQASGQLGSEDGAGKTIQGGADGVVEVSIGVFP